MLEKSLTSLALVSIASIAPKNAEERELILLVQFLSNSRNNK
tara:strand:- start:234 stop:359 length:126 start_codon:yes stop_codon:yes gene_type:complete